MSPIPQHHQISQIKDLIENIEITSEETLQKHWGEHKNIVLLLVKPKQMILMCSFF